MKCGKSNHSTQNHWEKGKHPQKAKGKQPQKVSTSSAGGSNKKKLDKKGKGKEKAKEGLNVLSIIEIPKVNIVSSQSIDYEKGDVIEWLLDSGCTKHITPVKSDLHNYKEFNPHGKAEVTDGNSLPSTDKEW